MKDDKLAMDQEAVEEVDKSSANEYLEFVGEQPHGVEFYGAKGTHSIDRKHMKDHHDVDLGAKEVVWKRGANGRYLVPVSDMTPEAAEVLANDPLFRRVTI